MKRTPIALAAAAAAAALTFLAGCSDDGDKDNADDAVEEVFGDTPSCESLDGETMTEDYDGCSVDDEIQAVLTYDDCDNGKTLLVSGPVYAFVGDPIIYSPDDGGVDGPGFQKLFQECYPS